MTVAMTSEPDQSAPFLDHSTSPQHDQNHQSSSMHGPGDGHPTATSEQGISAAASELAAARTDDTRRFVRYQPAPDAQELLPDDKRRIAHRRRLARIMAVQCVFEVCATGHVVDDVLQRLGEEEQSAPAVREYARQLVACTLDHLTEIDACVQKAAPAWPIEQIAAVDRAVLRVATGELLFHQDIPGKVAINEAVIIAKLYGGVHSGRFVNGVLGTIIEEINNPLSDSPPVFGHRTHDHDILDQNVHDQHDEGSCV